MSGTFWIALELSIPKMGLKSMLSLTVKKVDAFKYDGVAESDNTATNVPRALPHSASGRGITWKSWALQGMCFIIYKTG